MYYTSYSSSNRGGGFSCWFMVLCGMMRSRRDESVWEYTYKCHWFLDIFIAYGYLWTFMVTRFCLKEFRTCGLIFLPILIIIDILLIIIAPIWFVLETIVILIIILILFIIILIGNILTCFIPLILLIRWIRKRKERREHERRRAELTRNMLDSMMGMYPSNRPESYYTTFRPDLNTNTPNSSNINTPNINTPCPVVSSDDESTTIDIDEIIKDKNVDTDENIDENNKAVNENDKNVNNKNNEDTDTDDSFIDVKVTSINIDVV